MTAESVFHQELAERAERGALLPAVHLIIENTGLSTADAKRYYDDFVASRGITVNPVALAIQAANRSEWDDPADNT